MLQFFDIIIHFTIQKEKLQACYQTFIRFDQDFEKKNCPENQLFVEKIDGTITNIVAGNKEAVKCDQNCGSFCYGNGCRAAAALRHRYFGANIYFIYEVDEPKCFLCDEEITRGGLNNHFDQDCQVFKRPQNTAA